MYFASFKTIGKSKDLQLRTSRGGWLELLFFFTIELTAVTDLPLDGGEGPLGAEFLGGKSGTSRLREVFGFGPPTLPWPCMALTWSLVCREGRSMGWEGEES